MRKPLVSVVMAAYNAESFITETLDSILEQTFTDFEFIIIEDCSTDRTPEILTEYAARDQRVKLVFNEQNYGPSCRNRGLKLAQGRYISIMDADDIAQPERLAQQVIFLEKNPTIGVMSTDFINIDEYGATIARHHYPTTDIGIRWKMLFHSSFCNSSLLFRQTLLAELDVAFDKTSYAEDYELYDRMLLITAGANLSEYLQSVRVHGSQISSRHRTKQQTSADQVSQRAIHRLLDREDFLTLDEVNMLRYWYHAHKLTRPPTPTDFALADKALHIRQAFIKKYHPAKADEREITYRLFRGLLPLAFARQPGASILLVTLLKLAPNQVIKAGVMNIARRVKKFISG